jgi:hypothetical protein
VTVRGVCRPFAVSDRAAVVLVIRPLMGRDQL